MHKGGAFLLELSICYDKGWRVWEQLAQMAANPRNDNIILDRYAKTRKTLSMYET